MMAFEMTLEVAEEFWKRVAFFNANTEEKRVEILSQMAEEGLIKRVTHTNRTKKQCVEDTKKHYKVLDMTSNETNGDDNEAA